MEKRFVILMVTLSVSCCCLKGQYASHQAGLRAGYTGGLYYKAFSPSGNGATGFMALLSFRERGLQVTGLKIFRGTSVDEITPDLFFGWGYGGHAGIINRHVRHFEQGDYYYNDYAVFPLAGIDAYGFIEYMFREIPVSVSLSIKPFIEIALPASFKIIPGDIGLSVSYYF